MQSKWCNEIKKGIDNDDDININMIMNEDEEANF